MMFKVAYQWKCGIVCVNATRTIEAGSAKHAMRLVSAEVIAGIDAPRAKIEYHNIKVDELGPDGEVLRFPD
jgi:hypothetical protein